MQGGVSILRDDGTRGTVIASQEPGDLIIEFTDGSRLVIPPENLAVQSDGSYRISRATPDPPAMVQQPDELTIPVVEEELTVETVRVARAKVRVHKRVETRRELVDAPVTRENIVIEHVPVNRFVEETAPQVREENGVLIIPVIEEVAVVEKRLFMREEIRISKRLTTTNTCQTFDLRREFVDIEREEINEEEIPEN
jgi:uncharacterized protein (TIGR02271 family)